MPRASLTLDATARYLRVSTWTVRRRIKAGDLTPVVDDDGVLCVTVDSLRAYVERHTVPATTTPRSR